MHVTECPIGGCDFVIAFNSPLIGGSGLKFALNAAVVQQTVGPEIFATIVKPFHVWAVEYPAKPADESKVHFMRGFDTYAAAEGFVRGHVDRLVREAQELDKKQG